VPLRRLVFHVRRVDRDPRAFSSGALSIWSYDRTSPPYFFDSTSVIAAGQRRLPMVHVTYRPHVHVRLRPLEFALDIALSPALR